MDELDKISVIVTLFNKEAFIERCITSIASQTVRPHEIIVVNDRSTDRSEEKARLVLSRTTLNWTIRNRTNNGGNGPAQNTGIRVSTGGMIAFLDADDEWRPQHIEHLLGLKEKFPLEEAYSTSRELVDQGSVLTCRYSGNAGLSDSHVIGLEEYLLAREVKENPFRLGSMLFRAEALDDIGGLNPARRSENIDFLLRFMLSGKKVAWSPYVGLRVHRTPGSIMETIPYSNSLPWFYVARQAIESGNFPAFVCWLLKRDVARRKTSDLFLMARDQKINRRAWNSIFMSAAPFSFTLVLTMLCLPRRLRKIPATLVKTAKRLDRLNFFLVSRLLFGQKLNLGYKEK